MAKVINELFESMDVEQDTKVELQEAFDTAVLKKTAELIDEAVEKEVTEKVQVLEEEYKEKVDYLTESLDGYLETVVEEFVEENAPVLEAQINEEKSKSILELFDQVVKIAGVDLLTIQEAKAQHDLENDPSVKIDELEDKVSDLADKLIEARRETDKYLKSGLVAELSEGLTILEKAKFERLAETVTFEKSPAYLEKLEVLKEQITESRSADFKEDDVKLSESAFKQTQEIDMDAALDFSKYIK